MKVAIIKMIQLKIKRFEEGARLPTYGSEFSAGFDLYALEDCEIGPESMSLVRTGLGVSWSGPEAQNYYLRIAPRSGLSVKGLFVNAGVVDYDYRGEVRVVLHNSNKVVYRVKSGDRIAQGIMEKIERPQIIETEELDETMRGESGFGSTGN